MWPRYTYQEKLVSRIKNDLDRIRFSIGLGYEYWAIDDTMKMLQMCSEIEKILNISTADSLSLENKGSHEIRQTESGPMDMANQKGVQDGLL